MNVILGKDVVIEFYKAGAFRKFVCAENIEFTPTMELKSVKTVGDGIHKRYRGQSIGYTISVTGIIPYDEPDQVTAFDLLEYNRQMVDIDYRILFYNQDGGEVTQIRGRALINEMTISGPVDFAGASINMQGNGPYQIGSVPTCNAQITSAILMEAGELRRVMILALTGGPAIRYDYRYVTTNGGLITGTTFSPTWDFAPYEGGYMYITAICENGVAGPEYSLEVSDANLTEPCGAIIIEAEVSVNEQQRRVDIIDQAGAASYKYEYETTEGITTGTFEATTFFIDDRGAGQLRIYPVCESGLAGPAYPFDLTAIIPAAKIIDIGVDSPISDRTFTVYHSENAVAFRWQYRAGLDQYNGLEHSASWTIPDAGIGEVDVAPINAEGAEGPIATLVMSIGQSSSCGAKILATSVTDDGTTRTVTVIDFTIPFTKMGWTFNPDDPGESNTSGTIVSSSITGLPIIPGILTIKPYCSDLAFGETYYLVIT